MGQILPLLSTLCIIISGVFVAMGWRAILKKKRAKHKKLMIIGAIFALIFFILYMTKTIVVGSTSFAGPDNVRVAYLIFLLFHMVLATTSAVFGLVTLFLAFTGRFLKHKKLGRITVVMWIITVITGVTVYALLYLIYPSGETNSLLEAIF